MPEQAERTAPLLNNTTARKLEAIGFRASLAKEEHMTRYDYEFISRNITHDQILHVLEQQRRDALKRFARTFCVWFTIGFAGAFLLTLLGG